MPVYQANAHMVKLATHSLPILGHGTLASVDAQRSRNPCAPCR